MPWYQFTYEDFPTTEALDMVEDFMDAMVSAPRDEGLDLQFGLFKSRQKASREQTYYLYAETEAFQKFLDDYRAAECNAPTDAEHLSGMNVLQKLL
jgi:hypothetical protein